jgi:pimeloyl-ACP methyl ester carboxylesterase
MGGLSLLAETLDLPPPGEEPSSLWIEARDGVKLHALDWGGDGPGVIFLHGGALSAHTWDYVCLELRSSYRCVCLDLRGHGDSGWAEGYRVADYVGDVHDLVASLGWRRAHLVGMSLGGVIAAHTALTAEAFTPESLALIDVAPGVSFEATEKMRDFIGSEAVAGGVRSLIEGARRLGARGDAMQLAYRYAHLVRWNGDGTWSWKRDDRQPINYQEILGHLETLSQHATEFDWPTLLVRGERSRILSEKAAKDFIAVCSNGILREVPRAGHTVQEDNPSALAGVLREFWKSRQALFRP